MKIKAVVLCALTIGFTADSASADQLVSDDASLAVVLANGGTDTANAGTTCIKLASAVSSVCPSGWIAINNNNKQLVATALTAKASGSLIWLYYDTNWAGAGFHCPGMTFTPCSVISIAMK